MNRKDYIALYSDALSKCYYKPIKPYTDYIDFEKAARAYRRTIRHEITAAMQKVIDGVLYIENKPVMRLEPKTPRVPYSERAAYYEGRILARQEAYF